MKKFMWVALALSLFVIPAHAQLAPAADVSTGYSFLHLGGTNGANLNGGTGSIAFNANDWLGLVGDLGFYHGSPSSVSTTAVTYTFGPRLSYRAGGRVVPFGEALFGGSHLSASFAGVSASTNPFAYSFGGGADLAVSNTDKWTLRPEFEYVGMRENGATENCYRLSIGIVFHLGHK